MALFALPNPTKEVTVKFPIDKVKGSIKEVVKSFIDYTLLEEDNITNRMRILVKQTDGISKLSLDMGQHLDITLNEISENSTKLNLEVRRVVGVIDQQYEATRATNSLNTFLTLFSKSLEGTLQNVVKQKIEVQKKNTEGSKKTNKVILAIVILIVFFMSYKVYQIRQENSATPSSQH